MTYKVSLTSSATFSIKANSTPKIKLSVKDSIQSNTIFSVKANSIPKIKLSVVSGGVQVPARFSDLGDYNASGLSDKYVIMYDAVTQTYIPVNPDVILSASSNTETTQPGLPSDFVNTLDVDLDNKIDLDAGSF